MTSAIARAVREIEQEISKLQRALGILRGFTSNRGRRAQRRKGRKLSAQARKRMAAAQRARWAAWKAKHKKAT